jgi:hypothetical protein
VVDTTVLGHQPHPFPGEAFKRLDLAGIDGVVHDAGDHDINLRPVAG